MFLGLNATTLVGRFLCLLGGLSFINQYRLNIANTILIAFKRINENYKQLTILFFIHAMLLRLIYLFLGNFWHDYIPVDVNKWISQHPFPFNDLLPWLLILLSTIFYRLIQSVKIKNSFKQFKIFYQNNMPLLLLCSFGWMLLISDINHEIYSWFLTFSQFSKFSVSTTYLWFAMGADLILWSLSVLCNIAQIKRLKNYFKPAFILSIVEMFSKLIYGGISFYHQPQMPHFLKEAAFFIRLEKIFIPNAIIPLFYVGLAWLFYKWSWFEPTKIDFDQKIPKLMNSSKFWWIIISLLIAFNIFGSINYIYNMIYF